MKKLLIVFSISLVLVLFPTFFKLEASQDKTDININVNFAAYVKFIGTAVDLTKYYTVEEIEPGDRLPLGTLGLESNSVGNCDVQFASQNNFRLRHTVSNQLLTNYRIFWKGSNVKNVPNRELTLPCNSAASMMDFEAVARFLANPQAGTYQDILTLTVTTQ